MDSEILSLCLAFAGGIVAGFVGSISNGGGLVNIPLLLFLGLPVDRAIATNRLIGFGLFISAIPKYHKAGKVDWALAKKLIPVGILAGVLGSTFVIQVPGNVLTIIVGILLLLMLPVVLMTGKQNGIARREVSARLQKIGWVLFFLAMIYGGFFGGGAGIFTIFILVHFFGLTYIEANSTGLTSFFFLAAATSVVFIAQGLVDFDYSIIMGAGTYIGSIFGVKHSLKKGNGWVKVFYTAVLLLSSMKLLFF